MIERELPRHELEPLAGRQVIEVVVVIAVAVVPAEAAVHPLLLRQHVVDADGVVRVLDLLRQRRVLEVARAVGIACRQRPAEVLERGPRHRVDQVLRDDVAQERILLEAAAANRAARERVVDLVLRPERQQLREVAGAHLLGRHRRRAVVARPRLVDALEAVHEEGAVAAVVAGQHHRTAGGAAVAVVVEVRQRDVVGVGEEVVGEERLRRLAEVDGAGELVGAGLDHEVGDAALGIARRGVERRGLDLELLDDVGRRHVGGDDLARVRRRRARDAVDGQVAAIAAGAVHRVADDVRRFERPVEPGGAGVGDARREADEGVGIAVRRRQRRDAARVDDVAERGVGRLEQRRVGDDVDRFGRGAGGQREVDVQPVGDSQLDFAARLGEALELGSDAVGAGDEERRLEQAGIIGDDGDRGAHRHVGDGDRGARDDAARGVLDGAEDSYRALPGRRRRLVSRAPQR